MQRESVPAGNKAVVTKALGQTVSPHNHTFSPFPRRYTQHSQIVLRNQGNEWDVIMRASRITSQQTLGTARTPKQFATSHAHGGVSQPEGGTMRRHGGEEKRERVTASPRQQRLIRPCSVQPHPQRPPHHCCYYCSIPRPGGAGAATVIRRDKLSSRQCQ